MQFIFLYTLWTVLSLMLGQTRGGSCCRRLSCALPGIAGSLVPSCGAHIQARAGSKPAILSLSPAKQNLLGNKMNEGAKNPELV